MRKCQIPTCNRSITDDLLMCFNHWKRVPFNLQNLIVLHFQRDRNHKQRRPSLEYIATVRMAVDSVVAWEERKKCQTV